MRLFLALACLLSIQAVQAADPAKKPNILLIYADEAISGHQS